VNNQIRRSLSDNYKDHSKALSVDIELKVAPASSFIPSLHKTAVSKTTELLAVDEWRVHTRAYTQHSLG
jgi:hypothetical protein